MRDARNRLVTPGTLAEQLFPRRDLVDRQCRKAIWEIIDTRKWTDLACIELENLEETVWRNLGEIRNPNEDFDGFSARSTEYAAENSVRFLARASRHAAAVLGCIVSARSERELSILAEAVMRRRRGE